ncbi:unnamed protein product [Rotaria socialis]|uniref:UNC93-like protein n=2 Tax=Rotaria socialis TaxID=392032 RepID=A0A817YRA2_9BILA|nr:unnamed protein product [Rotaria socialis]CAF3383695.1 unnamed protein product [Rotaria socialis]CAF3453592.1 unnamed protein product [Rotaria socialis]CAF4202250.1 unnamed protein product [Rotaria socialis]CAF4361689.1 unnamed protein product [Rotaria socialis]
MVTGVELKSELVQTVGNDGNFSSADPIFSKEKSPSDIRAFKNVLVICFAFLLQFTAFSAIANLQSSLNTDANVGVNSLSIIYACLLLSATFLPHPSIATFGLKWTIVISQIPYLLYMVANYYPKAYFMYPTAALVGLAAAPLWTSKCIYLTEMGSIYAFEKKLDKNIIINRYFGIFFMFFQSGQIWGNLISYLVLMPEERIYAINGTENNRSLVFESYAKCGADFIEEEYQAVEDTNRIDRKTIDILCIIYICICVCSILIVAVFLDQRRTSSRDRMSVMFCNSMKLLVSTVKHLRHINQLLLIPITVWSGLEQSFLWTQFSKGFISCVLNAKYVGLILMVYGICDSIGSFAFGQLVKLVGRWPCFAFAAIINYALIITMLVWHPSQDQIAVLFVLAALWGVTDAIWQTQINAFYGVIFTENREAAFSNYRLWESTGFAFFYIITPYIRVRLVLIILAIFLSFGIVGYTMTEYRSRTLEETKDKAKKKNTVSPS